MMRRFVLLLCASALFTTLAAAATDAKLVSLLDPQTRVIAGLNGTAVKVSPFGQYLLSQSAKADLSHFIASTGFDPRTNLQQVLFGSAGDANNSQRVLLVKGTFVPAQVLAFAVKKGATTSSYRGMSVAEFPAFQGKNGKPHPARWLAFLSSTRAAFGTPHWSSMPSIDTRTIPPPMLASHRILPPPAGNMTPGTFRLCRELKLHCHCLSRQTS